MLIWDLTRGAGHGPLTAKELDALWTVLAGTDAAKAGQAIWRLTADPGRTLPYLKMKLRPVAPADVQQLARLLVELDSPQFSVRQRASQELEKLAELAIPVLRQALSEKGGLEFRRRVQALLTTALARTRPEHLRLLRAIEVLEHAASEEARHGHSQRPAVHQVPRRRTRRLARGLFLWPAPRTTKRLRHPVRWSLCLWPVGQMVRR